MKSTVKQNNVRKYAESGQAFGHSKPVPSSQPSPKPRKALADKDPVLPDDEPITDAPCKLRSLITQVTNKENAKKQPLNDNLTPQARSYAMSF